MGARDRINGKFEDLVFTKTVKGGELPVVEAEDLSEDRKSLEEYQNSQKDKESKRDND